MKSLRNVVAALVGAILIWPTPDLPSQTLLEIKLRLVAEINRDRTAMGLPVVVYSEELSRAADEHSLEMLREDYMSHWNRAGWKPYMRYSRGGIRDFTAENVWSLQSTHFDGQPSQLMNELLNAHKSFMAERPPRDGHRQAILGPQHTHVGIGVAFNASGIRLVQLFAARYMELSPLPAEASLKDNLEVAGRLLSSSNELFAISVYYEPLPTPMSASALRLTGSYGLPDEEQIERPILREGRYADYSLGVVEVDRFGKFRMPLRFWKRQPGVYTVAVWVRIRGQRRAFIGGMASVFVSGSK